MTGVPPAAVAAGLLVLYVPFQAMNRELTRAARGDAEPPARGWGPLAFAVTYLALAVGGLAWWDRLDLLALPQGSGVASLAGSAVAGGVLAALAAGLQRVAWTRGGPSLVNPRGLSLLLPGNAGERRELAARFPVQVTMEEVAFRAVPLAAFPSADLRLLGMASALLFGAYHTFEGLVPATVLVILGGGAFALVAWTGSVWPAVAAHAAFNAVGFADVTGHWTKVQGPPGQ